MTEIKSKSQSSNVNEKPESIFIGVSWPYASGNIHLGHLAGQYIVCDVFARYHRLRGNKVLMVSGSDSHGAPVAFSAEEQGITPQQLAKRSHDEILDSYKKLGLIYENYTSTTTENHKIVVQNLFLALKDFGFLRAETSEQYFDPKVERFLPDRYVRGTCPKCGATNARGDECPECGEFLSPEELIDPYSTLSDAKPIVKETEHFYLDLKKAEPKLKEWISKQDHWRKWVQEFTKGWLKMGLEPRAVTRDFDYGIPIPVEGWDKKVIYVWFEAVIGYLSAAIEWAQKAGEPSAWEDFWKNPDCKHYYFIAGGNVPFHTIIWPAELIAYNQKFASEDLMKKYLLPGEKSCEPLNLPYDVPANKMLTYKGRKMSKGDKTGIGLEKLMADYQADIIRYFFVKYAPENHDREYKWQDFIDANNNELVANIGNFINRTLSFNKSKFGDVIPNGSLDEEVFSQISKTFEQSAYHFEKAEFIKAMDTINELGHFANKYFNEQKPWETIKETPEKASNTIYNSIQIISAISTLIRPILPFSADKIDTMLNTRLEYDANKDLEKNGIVSKLLDTWKFNEIPSEHKLNDPSILFTKLEYTEELQKADNSDEDKLVISDEFCDFDFSQADPNIVIGKIIELKKHDQADRLNIAKVTINGKDSLEIVCGAPNLNLGDIVSVAKIGSKVLNSDQSGQAVKIKRAKIKGIASEGMLCSPCELGVGDEKGEILILPKSLEPYLGQSIKNIRFVNITKDSKLANIPVSYAVFQDVEIKKRRNSKLEEWIKQIEEEIKEDYKGKDIAQEPIHKAFRNTHREYTDQDIPGSSEDVIQFIMEKENLPEINNFVDLYNAFSAKTGVSIGAHDIAKLSGIPRLKFLEDDMEFRHATTNKKDVAKKGEYSYVDQKGILCHLDIKQGNRTKVNQDTKDILVIFQGNEVLNQEQIDTLIQNFKALVEELIS